MPSVCLFPISVHSRRSVRVRATSESDINKIITQNRRLKSVLRKTRVTSNWRSNNRRIVLEELASFLDVMDDVIDIMSDEPELVTQDSLDEHDDIMDLYEFCGEVPDDVGCKIYDV